MAEFEMTLAEALVLKSHLSALGYPCKRDHKLLALAMNMIVRERVAVVRRYDEFNRNNPSEGPSKDKLPASPDAGGGPNHKEETLQFVLAGILRRALDKAGVGPTDAQQERVIACIMKDAEWQDRARAVWGWPTSERYTVEPGILGSWLVFDNAPRKYQRSNWGSEKDARTEAARLNAAVPLDMAAADTLSN